MVVLFLLDEPPDPVETGEILQGMEWIVQLSTIDGSL